jgi:hypothetical protein
MESRSTRTERVERAIHRLCEPAARSNAHGLACQRADTERGLLLSTDIIAQAIPDDVAPFLERPRDAELLTRANLTDLLGDGGDAVLS